MAIRCLGDQKQASVLLLEALLDLSDEFFAYSAGWLTFSADFRLAAFFPADFRPAIIFSAKAAKFGGWMGLTRVNENQKSTNHTQSISSLPLLLSLQSP